MGGGTWGVIFGKETNAVKGYMGQKFVETNVYPLPEAMRYIEEEEERNGHLCKTTELIMVSSQKWGEKHYCLRRNFNLAWLLRNSPIPFVQF